MKNKFSIAMSLAIVLAMLLVSLAFADGTPTISTEYPDYGPGSVVNLFGAGWQAGESVHIFVNDNVGSSWSLNSNPDPIADGSGSFTYQFQLPSWFVATYSVTATGTTSGTAITTFTDAQPAHLLFTADTPCVVNVSGSYTNPGNQSKTFSGSTPQSIDVSPATSVSFTFATSVVCSGVTYNFASASQSSPFTSGAADSNTTVNGHYVAADSTPPVITPNVSGTLGNNGWYTSDVTVSWSVADNQSAISSTSGCDPTTISTDTAGVTLTCSATSAGGTSSQSVTIKRDATAPTLSFSVQSPAANANGWNNTNVSFPFTTGDNLSGVDTTNPASSPLVLAAEGSSITGTVVVTDKAGNSTTFTSPAVKIDKTGPSVTITPDHPANANGWYNSTIKFTASGNDALSGGVACSSIADYNGPDNGNASVSATCTDAAGNAGSGSFSFKYDATVPLANASVSPGANGFGWNNTDVTVTFSGNDGTGSGIASCSVPMVLSSEGMGLSASGTCTDQASNVSAPATASDINIDKTKPVITGSRNPAANGFDWNNSDVTVSFSCAEAGSVQSGIDANNVQGTTISTEGAGQSATNTGSCTDKAGNIADPATVGGINIDKTAPAINGVPDRAPNSNGWYNADVTVSFTCSDGLSDVATCSTPSTLGEGTNQSATGTATDKAGNSASTTVSGINIDKTKPSIVAAATTSPNANGWHNSNVTVHFTCTDALSGIPSGACPADQLLNTEGAAVASTAQTVTDSAGNTSDLSNVVIAKIDKTAPSLSPGVTPNPVLLNGSATASANASDLLSGIASSGCDAVVTNTVGTFSVNCTATDKAGNTATVSASYTVSFKVCALYDQAKSHKAGSTVPVKLQLCDAYGVNYSSISNVVQAKSVSKVDNSASSILDDSGAANAPDMNFRYDATLGGSGGYIFNLSTKGLTTGTWKLTFTVNGQPTTYFVQFDIK